MDTGYLTKLGVTHILNVASYDDRCASAHYITQALNQLKAICVVLFVFLP